MSYYNPQTVINTESAKYYANAISGIGDTTAAFLQKQGDAKRAKAKENREFNERTLALNAEFSSDLLSSVNDTTKEFDLRGLTKDGLTEMIREAAGVKVRLTNETNPEIRAKLQEDNFMYEQFFNGGGFEKGISNTGVMQNGISTSQNNLGSIGGGSTTQNNGQTVVDIISTMPGNIPQPVNIQFEKVNGAINMIYRFGENNTGAIGGSRVYNANTDFNPKKIVTIPNLNGNIIKTLQSSEYMNGNVLDQKKKGFLQLIKLTEDGKIDYGIKTDDDNKIITGRLFASIDEAKLSNIVDSNLRAVISSNMTAGNAQEGNAGYGLISSQAFVDDILEADLDKEVGTLVAGNYSVDGSATGLDKQSYDKLRNAILKQETRKLDRQIEGVDLKSDDPDGGLTAAMKTDIYKRKMKPRDEMTYENIAVQELMNTRPPKFSKNNTKESKAFIDYIEAQGLKVSKPFAEGGGVAYTITGVNSVGKSIPITVYSGEGEIAIKEKILLAKGVSKTLINKLGLTVEPLTGGTEDVEAFTKTDYNIEDFDV
mgnify:CR=1 FL=1